MHLAFRYYPLLVREFASTNSATLTFVIVIGFEPIPAFPYRVSLAVTQPWGVPPTNGLTIICTPYRIRTYDLRIRSALLYPTELREQKKGFVSQGLTSKRRTCCRISLHTIRPSVVSRCRPASLLPTNSPCI